MEHITHHLVITLPPPHHSNTTAVRSYPTKTSIRASTPIKCVNHTLSPTHIALIPASPGTAGDECLQDKKPPRYGTGTQNTLTHIQFSDVQRTKKSRKNTHTVKTSSGHRPDTLELCLKNEEYLQLSSVSSVVLRLKIHIKGEKLHLFVLIPTRSRDKERSKVTGCLSSLSGICSLL